MIATVDVSRITDRVIDGMIESRLLTRLQSENSPFKVDESTYDFDGQLFRELLRAGSRSVLVRLQPGDDLHRFGEPSVHVEKGSVEVLESCAVGPDVVGHSDTVAGVA